MSVSIILPTGAASFADIQGVTAQDIDSVLSVADPITAEEENDLLNGDKLLNSYTINEISTGVVDSATQNNLLDLGVPVDEVKKAEVLQDNLNYTGETYTKFIIDHEHYICVDEDNEIKSIYNSGEDILAPTWNDEFNTTESQYLATGEQVKEMLGLDDSYELVKSEEETVDFWFLAYRKVLSNGLVNENDGVNIMVARKDASVAFLNTFDMPANTLTAEKTEAEALTAANSVMSQKGFTSADIDDVELGYVQPNFFWEEENYEPANFVRLAYIISLKDSAYFIYVDAVTGEVIGGDMAMGSGGAFGDQYVAGAQTIVNLAVNGIGNTMGYSPVFSRCSSTNTTKNEILNFVERSDARAFYFSGHGWIDPTYGARISVKNGLGENADVIWRLYIRDLASYHTNWNFVFLSCCHLGTASCASAFNIYDSSDNKVYMGFTGSIISATCEKFNSFFWSQVGSSRLYNCAIYARNSIYDMNLNAPLYFTGDKYYWGGILG